MTNGGDVMVNPKLIIKVNDWDNNKSRMIYMKGNNMNVVVKETTREIYNKISLIQL
jgi:hypothetical protein